MKQILWILFCSILSASCKKYLEAKPNDQLTTPNNITALQALLDNGQYMNGCSPSSGQAAADEFYLLQSTYDSRTSLVQQSYLWNMQGQSDYNFTNVKDWGNLYYSIYEANVCLTEIDKIAKTTLNERQWDNVKGAAYFFRARSFLQLAWVYCKAFNEQTAKQDMGIILRLNADFNSPSFRSTVWNTYQQIIEDFKSAENYLPDLSPIPLRPSKAAVYGYLARTYLSMREYDSAYKYSNTCLGIYDTLIDYNDATQVTPSDKFPFQDLNPEVIHQSYMNSVSINSISQKNAQIDTLLFDSYDNNDIRKSAFFSKTALGINFKGSYNARTAWFTGLTTAEMFLTRAECFARSGAISSAMADLNHLLESRWKKGTFSPLTALDKEDALNLILQERRKELLFRDLRWIDIKRLNLEGRNIAIKRIINGQEYVLAPNDNRFAIPLPTDIVSLTGIVQNTQ